jgi:hypothetical protein
MKKKCSHKKEMTHITHGKDYTIISFSCNSCYRSRKPTDQETKLLNLGFNTGKEYVVKKMISNTLKLGNNDLRPWADHFISQ